MNHIGLFEGIGGFSLAARWMNWETIAWCEINEFCQKILKHHFPDAKAHGDIKETDFSIYRGQCDIVTGGFPCQPYSQAGKRKGKADDRHLWPEMLRAIREIQPSWVVGENVSGLLNWNRGMVLDEIKADLEASGFEVFPPLVLPAAGVNAPHRRDRIWIIAHSSGNGYKRWETFKEGQQYDERRDARSFTSSLSSTWDAANSSINGLKTGPQLSIREKIPITKSDSNRNRGSQWEFEPGVCGVADGIPNRVDRIKALGNAIVPQIAYEIFKAIEDCEQTMQQKLFI